MEEYKKEFARILAQTGAIFFKEGLVLKDGRPTPYFINIGRFNTGKLSRILGSFFADMMFHSGLAQKTDIVLGPSYKGSSIALATAISLWDKYKIEVFFDYDRKEYKIHGEMSGSRGLMVNNTLFDACKLFIVDDVVSSMNTKYEFIEKIRSEADEKGITFDILGIGIAVDREQSSSVYDKNGNIILGKKGQNSIEDFISRTGIKVYKIIGIKELITYLHNEKIPVLIDDKWMPITAQIKEKMDEYLRVYGTS